MQHKIIAYTQAEPSAAQAEASSSHSDALAARIEGSAPQPEVSGSQPPINAFVTTTSTDAPHTNAAISINHSVSHANRGMTLTMTSIDEEDGCERAFESSSSDAASNSGSDSEGSSEIGDAGDEGEASQSSADHEFFWGLDLALGPAAVLNDGDAVGVADALDAVYGGAAIGGAPFAGAPFGGAAIGGAPFGGAAFAGAPFGGAAIGEAPFGGAAFAGAPFGGAAIGEAGAPNPQIINARTCPPMPSSAEISLFNFSGLNEDADEVHPFSASDGHLNPIRCQGSESSYIGGLHIGEVIRRNATRRLYDTLRSSSSDQVPEDFRYMWQEVQGLTDEQFLNFLNGLFN